MDFDSYVFIGLIFVLVIIFWLFRKKPEEKEYERKLKESLKDEYIIDPETGIKLTLEEAESGIWLAHDNEFRTIPKEELDKLPHENEKQIQTALNYLRESRFFTKNKFIDNEIETIENTKILSGYDDWSYSDCFKFNKGFIFLPSVVWNKDGFYQETHLMAWIKIDSISGHYLFREKTSTEKIFDTIRNDDEIKLKDYECFTVSKSHSIIKINSILNKLISIKGLEIEIEDDNLFIKTLKLVSLEDVKTMELIISKFK